MTCLIALVLAAGAPPVPRADTTLDGTWTVVYAENVGRAVTMAPSLTIQNGTVTINIGQPVTYRLNIGPGHAIEAVPAADVSPNAPAPLARTTPQPGTLQGTFILSREYLCLSFSPIGADALGASPGTVTGNDVGPGAAPHGAPPAPPTRPPGPNAGGGGVRHDAFILLLRRGAPPALAPEPRPVPRPAR